MAYLVDTDVMVDLTRNNQAAIEYVDRLRGRWSISTITSLELIAGARNQRETAEIDLILSAYPSVPPSEEIARRAYYLMKTYARSHGLRTFDSLIAATALEEGLTLATKNRKHFHMIGGLKLDVPDY
jgi:predicted nucleic acid-binding protein